MAQDGHNQGVFGTIRGLVGRTARRDSDEESQDFQRDQDLIGASDVSSSPELVRSDPSSSPEMVPQQGAASISKLFEPDGSHGRPLPKFPFDHSKITFRPGVPGMVSLEPNVKRFGKIGRRPQACTIFESYKHEYPDDKDMIPCELSFEVADYYKEQVGKFKNARNVNEPGQATPPIITKFETYRNGAEDEMPYPVAFDAIQHYLAEIQKERKEYLKAAKNVADLKFQPSEGEVEGLLDDLIYTDRDETWTTQYAKASPEYIPYRPEYTAAPEYAAFFVESPKLMESPPRARILDHGNWSPILQEIRYAQSEVGLLTLKTRMLRAENQLGKRNWDNAILRVDEVLPLAESRREIELIARGHYVKGRAYFGRRDWNAAAASFETAEIFAHGFDFQDYFIGEWKQLAANKQNLL